MRGSSLAGPAAPNDRSINSNFFRVVFARFARRPTGRQLRITCVRCTFDTCDGRKRVQPSSFHAGVGNPIRETDWTERHFPLSIGILSSRLSFSIRSFPRRRSVFLRMGKYCSPSRFFGMTFTFVASNITRTGAVTQSTQSARLTARLLFRSLPPRSHR